MPRRSCSKGGTAVNCKEVIDLIDAYLDGELDPVTNNNIEAHLRECSRCEQAFKDHHALISAIGTAAPYHKSPQTLRERLQVSLRSEISDSAHDIQPQNREKNIRKRRRSAAPFFEWPWNWLGLAAALLLAVLIVWRLAPAWPWNGQQFLATELVSGHVRSLMVDHLTDVASSDQHTVKPWFDGKLDFAPNVVNPTADGFPLVGGRLD